MIYKIIIAAICSIYFVRAQTDQSSKIIRGWGAEEKQFPYQISLRRFRSHICGGSIISKNYVLTAAHCLVDSLGRSMPPNAYAIVAGTNSIRKRALMGRVKKILIHEKYDNIFNDIALLELTEPLQFGDSIQSIDIYNDEVPEGSDIIISGWGNSFNGGRVSRKLKFNIVTSISQNECNRQIGINYAGIICLVHPPNIGPCRGDSGGPAIYQGKLVGVANFAYRNCADIYPDAYAKVLYYIDWIKNSSHIVS